MMRHLRLLGLMSIAMLALFALPTVGSAQTPVQDQYELPPDADTDPGDDTGANTDPADDSGPAGDTGSDPTGDSADRTPVAVQQGSADGKLPFTGGSVPLVAMIGLLLLAAGLAGIAATRRRRASDAP